jgi:carbamate kinase
MLPKIEASIDFLKAGKDRCAIITSLDKALDSVYDKAGTVIR